MNIDPDQVDSTGEKSDASSPLILRTLAPSYNPAHHGIYVDAIVRAIDDEPSMRNIALTGAYGTGKSSVLSEVAARYSDRVLELSLSTVGVDEEVPISEFEANPAARTKSNRIQKEIVKQILYRDTPARTRGSRFRRIARFDLARERWLALGGAGLVLAILYITQLSSPLVAVAGENPWGIGIAYTSLFAVLAAIVLALRWLTHNRVFLEKLSAGPATVSLAAQSSSFFDQYMDEIVYYFEQSGRDIVIFEDIDRFEDVHILETLRALNTLLNGSDQVRHRRGHPKKRRGKTAPAAPDIKFIYALRDSIFERIGVIGGTGNSIKDSADDEIKRANRTKFFDLVIPIVPFITHHNARDLMVADLEGTGISDGLTDIAARHVADKRLIANMRNEYDIYANRLLGTPSQMPGMTPDKLFALILYKSVHMADFEAIRFGQSNLDDLHDAWRLIVKHCTEDALSRQRSVDTQLAVVGLAEHRGEQLGERLEQLMRALVRQDLVQHAYLKVESRQISTLEMRTVKFWGELAEKRPAVNIGAGNLGGSTYSWDQLTALLGLGDIETLASVDRREQLGIRRVARDEVTFLRHHTWAQLYNRPNYKAPLGEATPESFATVTARLLQSRLARDLVANEYLNDYFALYISVYYGTHLRLDALNFVVHSLDQGKTDIAYKLDPDDVEAILRDKGEGILTDRTAYNVSILDHLLATDFPKARVVVGQVAAWDKLDQEFANQYVATGAQDKAFIELLTPALSQVVIFALEVPTTAERRLALVDAALSYQSQSVDYLMDGDVAGYVLDNYTKFPSLTGRKLSLRKPSTMSAIAQLGVHLPDVARLNDFSRAKAIEFGAYELTESNLKLLSGKDSIALDSIRGAQRSVYDTVLSRIASYLNIIDAAYPRQNSACSPRDFLAVLSEVESVLEDDDNESIPNVIRLAAVDCRIVDIKDAPRRAWAALARGLRIRATASNILAYVDVHDSIDSDIAVLLDTVEAIEDVDEVGPVECAKLATTILKAGECLPSPTTRVKLAESLNVDTVIPVEYLLPEPGELIGRLIEAGLIEDDEVTFASALMTDWPTLKFAIEKSEFFDNNISPAVLPVRHLRQFFLSNLAPKLKDVVVQDIGDYAVGGDRQTFEAAARHALSRKTSLVTTQLEVFRAGGTSSGLLIRMIAASPELLIEDTRELLRQIGGKYALIADVGAKSPLIPDDEAHRRLLERLKDARVVSDHKPEKGQRRVSLRRS